MADFSKVGFADSREQRCACVLLLDTSGSMSGEPITELNAGLSTFAEDIKKDDMARKRVDVAVVTFGGYVTVARDFVLARNFDPPVLDTDGDTPMAGAVQKAVEMLHARKQQYKDNGLEYYRPWIFLITDGAPTDGQAAWEQAIQTVREGEKQSHFSFFAVGVEGADMKTLAQLSSVRPPLKLRGLAFKELFLWLSKSLEGIAQSRLDDEVPLVQTAWATVRS
ncbi:MAG: VWA domain-containing protein [Azoarcus sp.]|nr:VWA domain-containing protein [Azoarcus sp.]